MDNTGINKKGEVKERTLGEGKLSLMIGNTEVMWVDYKHAGYNILRPDLIPFSMRSGVKRAVQTSDAIEQCYEMRDILSTFLSERVLALDRENAKKILNVLGYTQNQGIKSRAQIAAYCSSVSVVDNYWTRGEKEYIRWEDVNIRKNKLNRVLAQVALHGRSATLNGKIQTPEITTHGVYAKCWKREKGELYLYKAGYRQGNESRVEVEVSNILDKTDIRHVKYISAVSDGLYCCKCKCMVNDKVSIVDASDYASYINSEGGNFLLNALRIDADSIYKMTVVDYLISNSDRHDGNWGFLYDSGSLKILGCHPLFDHNNAFDREMMENDNFQYQITGRGILESARIAVRKVNIKIGDIKRKDFISNSHYESFIEKAYKLGLAYRKGLFGVWKWR